MKKLLCLIAALFAALSLTACTADTVSGALPELSHIVDEILQTAEESSPKTSGILSTAETADAAPEPSEEPSATKTEQDGSTQSPDGTQQPNAPPAGSSIDENGSYTTKEDVALYIHTYGKLPQNFITKKEAQSLGWSGGSLEPYAPGKCIGGTHFGNYEGKLPEKEGRSYTECDIDTLGQSSRGAKRIVFSNDGLIYYTEDHYSSFTLLYGEE